MNRSRPQRVLLLVALAAGCATGGKLLAEADVAKSDIEKARRSGAVKCAPRETALAESNIEFALLEIFMQNPGRILTRTFICEKIWESHYDVDTNLLDVYMSKLRSKLEKPPERVLFKTVRGVGYQLL